MKRAVWSGGVGIAVVAALCGCGAREGVSRANDDIRSTGACRLGGEAMLTPLSRSSSQLALARSGARTLAFVADEDSHHLRVVDLDRGKELTSLALGSPPAGVLVSQSGRVAVALPQQARVEVLSFDGAALTANCAVETPAEPVSLALTGDEKRLVVVSAWGHALTAYGTDTMTRQFEVALARDPRGVVLDSRGRHAFVSHGVGGIISRVDLAAHSVREAELRTLRVPEQEERRNELRRLIAAPVPGASPEEAAELIQTFQAELDSLARADRFGNQGYALAMSLDPGGRVLIPHVQVDPGPEGQQTGGYGSGTISAATPTVAVLDVSSLEILPQTLEVAVDWEESGLVAARECKLPRAAAIDEKTGDLFVTCVGADVLVRYDAASPNPIDAQLGRVQVPAGPTGLALDSERRQAVVWSQFERTLSVVPLGEVGAPLVARDPEPRRIALQAKGLELDAKLSLGRILFHKVDDPRIASDGRACASCHIGGRDDGLVWSTPHGPRRTKTLDGMAERSAPYSWDGQAETLHVQLEGTFERLQGQGGLRGRELEALAAYVASLAGPPRARNREDRRKVQRGAEIFASTQAGCASCHQGELYTDSRRHDVKSDTRGDATSQFDTPSLRFLQGRAPYFHDGRYGTLRELLTDSDGKMGHTAHLSAPDLDALEAYLRTL